MTEEKFDIKQLLYKARKYWYLFALIFPAALALAYFYLKTTPPKYQVEAKLLIKDDENSGQLNEEIIFSELGLGKKNKNLENEVLILTSSPLMQAVVENHKLHYRYFQKDGMKSIELYQNAPVVILDWHPNYEGASAYGQVIPNGKGGYTFVIDEETSYNGEFGTVLELPEGKLNLARNNGGIGMEGGEFFVLALSAYDMAWYFLENLKVEINGEESSTLSLTLKDVSPQRARDVLAGLIEEYNKKSVEDKNKAFENTIDLINERIELIAEELSEAERAVESYKSSNQLVELSSEGSLLMTELVSYNREAASTGVQLEILNSIQQFLEENKDNFDFVPTNITINNLTLTSQLETFNKMLADYSKMKNDLGALHPDLILVEKQIQNLRKTIIENIQAMKGDLEISLNSSQNLAGNLEGRLRSLPKRERELVEKERKKVVKENLYLYLLQKREESAISMAVTAPTGKLVEPAITPSTPVSPKGSQIWLIAFFLGLALPTGLVLLIENLNDKIMDEVSVEKATSVPLLGSIAMSRRRRHQVVKEKSTSIVAEMFRLLRANLHYLTPAEDLKVLLVTSSFSGEGKSFISLNLGMTMALSGKRVLVLELDLRKPKQNVYMGIERAKTGIVDYLVEADMKPHDVIYNSGLHENLDVIVSGPKPPNPSELILSPRLRILVDQLREEYDFIILDSPPVGMVADALQLKDLPQATMYVTRAGVTRIPQLRIIEDIAQKGKLPKPFIVLNGLKLNQPGSYGYGYGYGYGNYGAYYDDEAWYKKAWSTVKNIGNKKKTGSKDGNKEKLASHSSNGTMKTSKKVKN
ncbi:MAG: polysaccharide biosynthesis tyrosine autokinase [Saprospiraceae bacterium]